jgi:SAM-dependent methyltransferase
MALNSSPLRSQDRAAINSYLEVSESPRLHLGAGPVRLAGWLDTDLEPAHPSVAKLDARDPLPFDDNILDYVFAEHLIEHLDFHEGQRLIEECFRTLRPGGILRLATPDLRQIARLVLEELDETQGRYVAVINSIFGADSRSDDPTFTVNASFYEHGHRFLYTSEILQSSVRAAGFVDIRMTTPLISERPDLCGLETHGRVLGDERLNTYECMVVEASVPERELD